mmetsp:Transcript_5038/g.447  ORF Transcript_5038/g.447 Transcript_5038/m.447 type:complete len:90 (+) Transcript_5038:732-1001(+)
MAHVFFFKNLIEFIIYYSLHSLIAAAALIKASPCKNSINRDLPPHIAIPLPSYFKKALIFGLINLYLLLTKLFIKNGKLSTKSWVQQLF